MITTNAVEYLRQHGINQLYHFTSRRNLDLIRELGGLWSARRLDTWKCRYISGSNDLSRKLDEAKNLLDRVHLALTPDHPMLAFVKNQQRVPDPVLITVDIDFLSSVGAFALYSNDNAASRRAVISNDVTILTPSHLKLLAEPHNAARLSYADRKNLLQAEIMIDTHIPQDALKNWRLA